MDNFELLLSRMSAENPYCFVITGDFHARSLLLRENDLENDAGKLSKPFATGLGLQQLITHPTHFMGYSRSCIDLILKDQPNLFIGFGVHTFASLQMPSSNHMGQINKRQFIYSAIQAKSLFLQQR